jgi:DNA adenine methylase
LSGGFSLEASNKRFTQSSIDRIEALDFTNIEIYNEDFYDFIMNNASDADASLLFLDPPYYLENKSNKLYGNNGDLHHGFNHLALFDLLKTRTDWVLTYNNCEYIRDLYKDFKIIDVKWSYGMNSTKASAEVIIVANKMI